MQAGLYAVVCESVLNQWDNNYWGKQTHIIVDKKHPSSMSNHDDNTMRSVPEAKNKS